MDFLRTFICEADMARPECHCSTIVELPGGDLLGAWYQGTREGLADVAVMVSRFCRDACVWTEPAVLWDTPGMPEGNPVLFLDAAGRVRLFFVTIVEDGWSGAQLKEMSSDDEGCSWSDPVIRDEPLGTMVRNKPLRLDDGRIILPMYDDRVGGSFMYISDDGGDAWRRSDYLPPRTGPIQPTLFRRDDGVIVALMRNDEPRYIQRSESHDRGESWSPAVSTFLPNPNAGCDVVQLASGHLLLAFDDSQRRRTPLSLAWSEDEGETWLLKLDLETEDGEFSYPAIIQARDGLIHVSYTWRRKGIAHVALEEEWFLAKARRRTEAG